MAPLNRVEIERCIMTDIPLSSGVITLIQASRRDSTTRIYEATWGFSLPGAGNLISYLPPRQWNMSWNSSMKALCRG